MAKSLSLSVCGFGYRFQATPHEKFISPVNQINNETRK